MDDIDLRREIGHLNEMMRIMEQRIFIRGETISMKDARLQRQEKIIQEQKDLIATLEQKLNSIHCLSGASYLVK